MNRQDVLLKERQAARLHLPLFFFWHSGLSMIKVIIKCIEDSVVPYRSQFGFQQHPQWWPDFMNRLRVHTHRETASEYPRRLRQRRFGQGSNHFMKEGANKKGYWRRNRKVGRREQRLRVKDWAKQRERHRTYKGGWCKYDHWSKSKNPSFRLHF